VTASAFRARPARRARAVALLLAGVILVTACATTPRDASAPAATAIVADFPRSRQVAIDFVDAMSVLPALVPGDTTLFTTRPTSRFGEILVATLQGVGYDIRLGVEESPVTLDYDVSAVAREGGGKGGGEEDPDGRYAFLVVANGVRLERRYVADLVGIRAESAMRVNGRDVATPPDAAPEAAPDAAGSETGRVEPDRASRPTRRNVYDLRRSNYADILQDYDTVRREIMVFPDDSLHMGPDNKLLARRIAEAFDPERDVISVIGCSHGRTALPNGNETLANGRSYRVKEAFMLAGIDADLVLEEGCWAGVHFSEMPARGVVVTHRRRTSG